MSLSPYPSAEAPRGSTRSEQCMNCPKCNYPDGPKPGDHFKGIYAPDAACAGCGFVETDFTILMLYAEERRLIKAKMQVTGDLAAYMARQKK